MRRLALAAAFIFVVAAAVPVYRIVHYQIDRLMAPPKSDLARLLDPRRLALNLCGQPGQSHGLFFRPDFALSIFPRAEAAQSRADEPPLWPGLGTYSRKISTKDGEAQAYFDQGLRLTYGFNHWEAIRAFRKAQEIDPTCAMCYWGEALALGPNINASMDTTAVAPAFAAIAKAAALKASANTEEQALIEALAKRYSADSNADRAVLDKAYAAAMSKVHISYPDDQDVATLYAESVMDLAPWDYWERDFVTPRGKIGEAIAAIEGVLERNPDHPGAIHLYIHLVEASKTPERAEPYADRLVGQLPGAGHIVHMPSHIYFRVGRYRDSLKVNVKAVNADEAYLAQAKGSELYRYGYYPHNVHFVLVSAQMAGDGKTAVEFANKLDKLIPAEMVDIESWIAPIKAAPYFAYAQFGDTKTIMALPDPGDIPYLKAMWHYTRGIALARDGNAAGAMREADDISALNQQDKIEPYLKKGVPAGDIFTIAEMLVRARAVQGNGQYDRAIPLFERAAELQDALPYQEPPYWYYAIRQTLGAAYLQSGHPKKAADAFIDSLVHHPNSAWSLYGLLKAQKAIGDTAAMAATADLLKKAAIGKGNVSLDRL